MKKNIYQKIKSNYEKEKRKQKTKRLTLKELDLRIKKLEALALKRYVWNGTITMPEAFPSSYLKSTEGLIDDSQTQQIVEKQQEQKNRKIGWWSW